MTIEEQIYMYATEYALVYRHITNPDVHFHEVLSSYEKDDKNCYVLYDRNRGGVLNSVNFYVRVIFQEDDEYHRYTCVTPSPERAVDVIRSIHHAGKGGLIGALSDYGRL